MNDRDSSFIKSCTVEQTLEDSIDECISILESMSEVMCHDCKAKLRASKIVTK